MEQGVFTVGLATSAAAGLALGPVGVGVAVVTYTVVFAITSLIVK